MFQPRGVIDQAPRPAGRWFAREAAATFALAWPLVLANIASNAMSTTDVMMLGWLSPQALAAGALGFNLVMPLFMFGVGAMSAVSPLAAALAGADARDVQGPRRALHQAFLSAILLAVPLWALLWFTQDILTAFGEDAGLAAQAGSYMHGYQWCLLPAFLFFAARSAFAALGGALPTLVAGLVGVAVNAALNYLLIFGNFGFPAWGVFGSGIATSIAQCVMLGVLVLYAAFDARLSPHRLFALPWRLHRPSFAQFWRIGGATGAMFAVEVAVFAWSVLVMGLIGAAPLAAHAIVFQIASLAFMVPLGIAQAATVRVGHAFGARDAAGVSRAAWAAAFITGAFMLVSAATMLAFPRLLISGFIGIADPVNAPTVALALSFIQVAALFQVVDGGQAVAAGMLRGIQDARVPMLIAVAGYWLVGAPVGLALAFLTPLAGLGLWIGLASGLAFVAVFLWVRWRRKERQGLHNCSEMRRE